MDGSDRTGGPPDVEESFYRALWSSEDYSQPTPNGEELSRWKSVRRLLQTYKREAPPPPQGHRLRILDLGCGRGWLTYLLTEWGDVVGADPYAVDIARRLFPGIFFLTGTAHEVASACGQESFDVVVASEVLEHVRRKDEFLRAVKGLLVGGGAAILTTPRAELWLPYRDLHPTVQPRDVWLTERQLDDLAREAGFKIIGRDRAFAEGSLVFPFSGALASTVYRALQRPMGTLFRATSESMLLSPVFRSMYRAASIYQAVLLEKPR